VYEETLTGRPHDTSVQKAISDSENVDADERHAQDQFLVRYCGIHYYGNETKIVQGSCTTHHCLHVKH